MEPVGDSWGEDLHGEDELVVEMRNVLRPAVSRATSDEQVTDNVLSGFSDARVDGNPTRHVPARVFVARGTWGGGEHRVSTLRGSHARSTAVSELHWRGRHV